MKGLNNKSISRIFLSVFLTLLFLFILQLSFAQQALYFASANFTTPNTWTQASATAMTEIPTGSGYWRHQTTSNGTGNRYYRYYSATAGGTTYEPNGASDIQVSLATSTALQVTGSGKAWYIGNSDIDNGTSTYVFKTGGSGTPGTSKQIVFRVQGSVQTVSSVSKSPASPTSSDAVTVTATLSGAFATGQGAYLRYSTNNWSTSTIVSMTSATATTYTATIPAQVNCTSVSYYVFTSGNGLTIATSDADYYTINLNNNGGSNYSYTVGTGCCPSVTCTRTMASGSSTTVSAGETVCINSNYAAGTITLDGGTLFIQSAGTIDASTRVSIGSTASRSITNCGTLNWSATGDYDFVDGTAGNYLTITNYGTMTTSQSSGSTFYIDDYNKVYNYGTMTFGGRVETRHDNSSMVNYSGATLNVTNKLNINKGTVGNYGTLAAYDLEVINNASASMTMYDGSLTRVTHDLYTKTNGFVYGDASGSAYLNHTGGNNTNPNNNLTASSNITYCGPITGAKLGSATAGTSCPFPLPVKLIHFSATTDGSIVKLKWVSAIEINNENYTLEKSEDGIHFVSLAIVNGAGTSYSPSYYEYTDVHPFQGVSYYRLKQTDFDGTIDYFKIIPVRVKPRISSWMLYPNPSGSGSVKLIFLEKQQDLGDVNISLNDAMGQKIIEKNVNLKEQVVDLFGADMVLSKGIYFVKVVYNNEVSCERLIVQ